MSSDSLCFGVHEIVYNIFQDFYRIHLRQMAETLGVGSVDYAIEHGNTEVATQAILVAQSAADIALKNQCTDREVESTARNAALEVFDDARKAEVIFLRDGSKSMTMLLAWSMAKKNYTGL